ncbi:MAG: hypothetical protein IPH24_08135 [Crocinitomicaceae bacterium]|nr:hypothetical protein [Crocinitomicaceae bacterium]
MNLVADKIELTHSTIILRKDGMLELHTHDNHLYEIDHVKENVEALEFSQIRKEHPSSSLVVLIHPQQLKQESLWLVQSH